MGKSNRYLSTMEDRNRSADVFHAIYDLVVLARGNVPYPYNIMRKYNSQLMNSFIL